MSRRRNKRKKHSSSSGGPSPLSGNPSLAENYPDADSGGYDSGSPPPVSTPISPPTPRQSRSRRRKLKGSRSSKRHDFPSSSIPDFPPALPHPGEYEPLSVERVRNVNSIDDWEKVMGETGVNPCPAPCSPAHDSGQQPSDSTFESMPVETGQTTSPNFKRTSSSKKKSSSYSSHSSSEKRWGGWDKSRM